RLHALAARDARARAHRILEVEDDAGVGAAAGVPDDVVPLDVPAGAHAARALDAGVQPDRDGRVREVRLRLAARGETRLADAPLPRPLRQFRVRAVLLLGHVGEEQLEDHSLRVPRTLAGRTDHHPLGGLATARR